MISEIDGRKVTLDSFLMNLGKEVGLKRHKESLLLGRFTEDKEGEYADIVGAQAEIAAAMAKNVSYVPTWNTFKNKADIGRSIEVRFVKGWDYGHSVRIKKNDRDSDYLVVVGGEPPDFVVWGFHYIKAMREMSKKYEWHCTNDYALFPICKLLPIEALSSDLFIIDSEVRRLENEIERLNKIAEKFQNIQDIVKMGINK